MNISAITLIVFTMFILWNEIDLPARLKILLGIRISKQIKPLDCMPCATFWISIVVSIVFKLDHFTPLACYLLTVLLDRKNA